jgi:hypothetical protein
MNLHDVERRFLDQMWGRASSVSDTDPPADRVEIYAQLVVGMNHGLLDHVFENSFDCIEEAELGRRVPLVREFVSESPPRSHSARELADRFVAWLELRHPEMFEKLPELRRLLSEQRIEQQVLYAKDEGRVAFDAETLTRLGALDVDQLLAFRIELAPWARLLHPLGEPTPSGVRLCTRDADGFPVWLELEQGRAAIVHELEARDGPASLEQLAAGWMRGAGESDSADEAEVFTRFLADVFALAGDRVVVAC